MAILTRCFTTTTVVGLESRLVQMNRLRPADFDGALALNNAAVPHVNELDREGLADLAAMAVKTYVVGGSGNELGALLVVLQSGSGYQSLNYRTFSERYDHFWYVDRIIISPTHRRQGIGAALYRALDADAADAGIPRICLEVNVDPPNPGSTAFHHAEGYATIDQLRHPDGHVVALMTKELGAT